MKSRRIYIENNLGVLNTIFVALLTLVFIVLKLTGVMICSWLWILSPIWIGFLLYFSVFTTVLINAVIKNIRG